MMMPSRGSTECGCSRGDVLMVWGAESKRRAWVGVRQPPAYGQAGYYPTEYCVRQDRSGQRTVSLEGFRFSQASYH